MIYNTFADVKRNYRYAQEYIDAARNAAINYLTSVVEEVFTIGIVSQGQPMLLTKYNGEIVVFTTIGKFNSLENLSFESLLDISKEVRRLRLVEEYGDNERPEEKEEK